MEQQKTPGFENYLSEFGAALFDSFCGEPVSWGFKIIRYLGEDLFREFGKYGQLEFIDGFNSFWALVVITLKRQEGILLYEGNYL